MTQKAETQKASWILIVIGLFGLVWNLMGVANFVMQQSPDMLAQMPPSHQAIAEARPIWGTLSFAISVFAGALGPLALIFKRRFSTKLLILSLLGTIGATAALLMKHDIFAPPISFGPLEIGLAVTGPVLVGVFLLMTSLNAKS